MGHLFRFSLDKRYVLAKTQMPSCMTGYLLPDCIKDCICSKSCRFYCLPWDVFNLNLKDLNRKERNKSD